MKAIVYIFHCLPQNAKRYQAELGRRGLDAEVIHLVLNGFSTVYREVAEHERTISYIDGLIKHHPPRWLDHRDPETAIVLASWSAGYGYPIVLLGEEASAQRIDGVVFIDSCYSSIDYKTGAVVREMLSPIEGYAQRARQPDGASVLWWGYADVPTSGQRPSGRWQGYGSTQQTAESVARWVGGLGGGFRTKFFDTQRGPRGNHTAAMLEWGPSWLADAVEQLRARRVAAGLEPHPSRSSTPPPSAEPVARATLRHGSTGELVREWQDVLLAAGYSLDPYGADGDFGTVTARATRAYQASRGLVADGIVGPVTWGEVSPMHDDDSPHLPDTEPALDTVGEMALQVARELQASGVAEIPGPGAHPVILAAFACCERGGRVGAVALQSDEYAWCAAFFSYCQLEAELRLGLTRSDTGFIPRAAVWELHHDAIERADFYSATEVRSGSYVPHPGDAWIQVRDGHRVGPPGAPFAHSKGLGHVGRIVSWEGQHGTTIDGNINDKVTVVQRSLDDPEFVGIIHM